MFVSIRSRSNDSDDTAEANRARIFQFIPIRGIVARIRSWPTKSWCQTSSSKVTPHRSILVSTKAASFPPDTGAIFSPRCMVRGIAAVAPVTKLFGCRLITTREKRAANMKIL